MAGAHGQGVTFSVLAQVVASRGLQPEPVATDALTHLLSTWPSAGATFAQWAGALAGESFELTYSTQVSTKDLDGRPDLIGADDEGVRVVGEAKFDAMLTKIQEGDAYLERLPKHQAGLLLFIVPGDRLVSIWPQVVRSVTGSEAQPPSSIGAQMGILTLSLGDGRTVAAVSWEGLLQVLQHGVDAAADVGAKGDLEQLRGLVRWRSRTGWVPLAPGDLPELAGRQLRVLRDCVLSAAKQVSVQKVRNGTGDWGPGRYVKTHSGRWMYAGISLGRWDRHGISPLWVAIQPKSDKSFASLTAALAPLEQPGGPGRYSLGGRDLGVPLQLPAGAELDAVTASLVTQLETIGALVDLAVGDVATAEPEELQVANDSD